jgi:hypothetical protein
MANFTDLAGKVGAYCLENKEGIFTKLLADTSFDNNFELETGIPDELVTVELEVSEGAKPFKYAYTAVDTQKFNASKLKVRPALIAEPVFAKEYYANYRKLTGKGVFNPNEIPLEQFLIDEIVRINRDAIRKKTIWQGVYAPAATTPGVNDICDGFRKQIADGITAGTITPVSTVGTPTAANIMDAVDEVILAMSDGVRGQPDAQILLSEQLFIWYKQKYRATHYGQNPEMLDLDTIVHEDYPSVKIKREVSLTVGLSKRIIGTYKRNLQVGTAQANLDNFILKTKDNGTYFDILMEFELGTQIAFHKYLFCNATA